MKAIISLFCVLFFANAAFALSLSTTESSTVKLSTEKLSPDVDCDVNPPTPGDVILLPDPDSCEHFYMCVGLDPVRKDCPDGLHYNEEKRVCDWPENAGCDPSFTETPN